MQGEDENRLLTIPNVLTMFRILLVPFFVITFYQHPDKRYLSLGVFALASLTDGIDGYLARKLKQVTNFGKLCDPVADKLMIICMLFCLKYVKLLAPGKNDVLNSLILYSIFAKELYMMLGGIYMLRHNYVVHSNIVGKSATALYCAAIIAVFPGKYDLPWHGVAWLQKAGLWAMLVATLLSFIAMIVYTRQSVKILKHN